MMRSVLSVILAVLVCARAMAQDAQGTPLVVEDLVCRGNASTSCTFILGQVYLAEGDQVDEEELENAKLRLLFLRNFASVSIYLEKGSERGKARVVVEVTEANPVTTELLYGLFAQNDTRGQSLNGRATHYNLFGSGKILDARANVLMPFEGPQIRQYFARLQYIDPHLFDSKRNFFSVGAAYLNSNINRGNGDNFHTEQSSYDITFGRRLWDFSYVTIGLQHRPVLNRLANVRQSNGKFVKSDANADDIVTVLGFGWNSEDDGYFPTRGSRFEAVRVGTNDGHTESSSILARKTWTLGRSYLTAEYQEEDTFGVLLARPFMPRFAADNFRRGRWFVSASVAPNGFNDEGVRIKAMGLNGGVVFETNSFGIVELFVSYTRDLNQ